MDSPASTGGERQDGKDDRCCRFQGRYRRTVDILGWHWNSLQGQWSFRSLLRAACMESTDPANGLIE
ncbi:hypothetical protein ZWY2020_054501 [Hordeum vulgare]|nr:hypothetical protein ZWY2020_054501 [Hordeum vulgare]